MRLGIPWCRVRDVAQAERKLHAMTRVLRANQAKCLSDVATWAMTWHTVGLL